MKRVVGLLTIILVLMPMFSSAQVVYQRELHEILKKVFLCAPAIGCDMGGTSDIYSNMGAHMGIGCADYGHLCRFGSGFSISTNMLFYYACESPYTPGTVFYVGPMEDGNLLWCSEILNEGPCEKGRCYSADGTLMYEGYFREPDAEEGWSPFVAKPKSPYPMRGYSNKRFEIIKEGGNVYLGETVNGVKHGWAIYVYPNGDCLYGEWKNGKKSGFGMKIIQNTCSIIYSDNWTEDYKPGNME